MLLGLVVLAVAGAVAYGSTSLAIQGQATSSSTPDPARAGAEEDDEHRPTSKAAVLVTSAAALFVWALFESGAWMVTLYAVSGLLLGAGIRLLNRPRKD